LGDDVRRVLRPARGELHAGLEEGVGAVLVVRDARVAPLPHDGVVRVDTRFGEEPTNPDPDLLRRHGHVAAPYSVVRCRPGPSGPLSSGPFGPDVIARVPLDTGPNRAPPAPPL